MINYTHIALPLAALLALSACAAPAPTPAPAPAPTEDTCGAAGFASLVGQDASVLLATTFTTPIRIVRPGDMVTMDFSPARANFEVGADETVTRVYCG